MTRERLYLDTMQEMFSNTSKVLVTGGNKGQNNLLYLPLDKMIESGRATNAPAMGAPAAGNEVGARAATEAQQQHDTRTRESR